MSLGLFIQILLLPFLISAYALYKYSHNAVSTEGTSAEFAKLQKLYFLPYFMALFSDWLQGPYVYKLYSHYGFAQGQIAVLFLMGFASSVLFGTATGPLADKFGRKNLSIVFCVLYLMSCLTKLSPDFNILLLGRILGGISTSILFSVFESWYLYEHTTTHKFPLEWTSVTFSKATFFNGLLAIVAGLVADMGVDVLGLGPVAPFMIAIPFLLCSLVLIEKTWGENYGEKGGKWEASCLQGLQTILHNPVILLLGLLQSIFESNMYIFVFLWTPVLSPASPPLGLTFSCFMIAIMLGSSLFSILLRKGLKAENILTTCLSIMAFTLFFCALLTNPTEEASGNLEKEEVSQTKMLLIFILFLALEISVGMYFPTVGYLRGEIVPEGLRANIMNWFRVPLNVITCGVLIGIRYFDGPRLHQVIFTLCAISALIGILLSKRLTLLKNSILKSTKLPTKIGISQKSGDEESDEEIVQGSVP